MKLRASFPSRQLIFAILGVLLLAIQHPVRGQGAMDALTIKTNPPTRKTNVLIVEVKGGKVMVREGTTELGYTLDQVTDVVKAAPAEFGTGMRYVEAGDMEKAEPLLKAVADRYKGLPTQWAQDATAMMGNIELSLGKLKEADAAFRDFAAAYGAANSSLADVGRARLAAARGKYEEAKSIATRIVGDAMSKKNITRSESQLYGQAYFVLGQCAENEKKLPEAMENYCRTVAIFYQERSVVKEAEKRIEELRQQGVSTP